MNGGLLRTDAVDILAKVRSDMLSVVTMQALGPWKARGQADCRNFNVQGSMGSAAAIGLGLALARPDERILVIDGDGSLLMQLASLVSVAEQQPANFYHVVFENGIYETSGGQSVPGRQVANLSAIALASGYRHARTFSSADEMDEGVSSCLHLDGPVFISLVISGAGVVHFPPNFQQPPSAAAQLTNMRSALSASAGR